MIKVFQKPKPTYFFLSNRNSLKGAHKNRIVSIVPVPVEYDIWYLTNYYLEVTITVTSVYLYCPLWPVCKPLRILHLLDPTAITLDKSNDHERPVLRCTAHCGLFAPHCALRSCFVALARVVPTKRGLPVPSFWRRCRGLA